MINSTYIKEATQELLRRCKFLISVIFVSGIIAPTLMFFILSDLSMNSLGCLFLILMDLILFIAFGLKYFSRKKIQAILIDIYCIETYTVDVLGYLACIILGMTIINPLTLSFRAMHSRIYSILILVIVAMFVLFIIIFRYLSAPIRKIGEERIIPGLRNKNLGKFVFDFMNFASTVVSYRGVSRKLLSKHIQRIAEFSEQILLENKKMLEPLKRIKRIAQEIIIRKAEIRDAVSWESLQDIVEKTIMIIEILFEIIEELLYAPVCIGGYTRRDLEDIRKVLKNID